MPTYAERDVDFLKVDHIEAVITKSMILLLILNLQKSSIFFYEITL